MSLNLQNDVARRLQRGGSRHTLVVSELFGRSCRLLEATADGNRGAASKQRRAQSSSR